MLSFPHLAQQLGGCLDSRVAECPCCKWGQIVCSFLVLSVVDIWGIPVTSISVARWLHLAKCRF